MSWRLNERLDRMMSRKRRPGYQRRFTALLAATPLLAGLIVAPAASAQPTPTPTSAPLDAPTIAPSGPGGPGDGPPTGGGLDDSGQPGGIPGLVVKYAPGVVAPLSADARVPGAASVDVELTAGAPVGLGWFEVDLAAPVDQQTAQQIAAQLMTDPAVEYAEPQLWLTPANLAAPTGVTQSSFTAETAVPAATPPAPNDPNWLQQWGFASYGQDNFVYPATSPARDLDGQTTGTNLLEALGAPRGPAPVVAVIDTGVTNHPDLAGRLTSGYNFISDPARAGNAFGRGSNFTDLGDWVTPDQAASVPFSLPGCPAPAASSWHGTHVSGTIAALTNNSLGVAGSVPADIQTLRALGRCGGSSGDIASAILWAAGGSVPGVPPNTRPARVINMSLGALGFCPQHVQDVLDFADSRGTVVVTAAGNSDSNALIFTPGNCAGVINVAATDPYGARAPFSNFGSVVDVAAPGQGIMSTLDTGAQGPVAPSYAAYSGTSMAAPHVSGAVALLLAAEPYLTPQQVRDRVATTATPFKQASSFATSGIAAENPAYDCFGDDHCGAGYLNTAALLGQASANAPVIAPRYQTRAAGAGVAVRTTFQPSPSGAEEYRYRVSRGATLLAEGTTAATDFTVNVAGSPSENFAVMITPRSGGRNGVAATAMRVPSVSGAAPAAPVMSSVEALNDAAFVTVKNSYATPQLVSTTVTAQPGGSSCELLMEPGADAFALFGNICLISGLTPGQEYTFTARSTNAVGTSPASAAVKARPLVGAPPTRPQVQSVDVQGNTATVRWKASVAATGRKISAYRVSVLGAEEGQLAECTVAGSSSGGIPQATFCQVPNLHSGQDYQFIVTAFDDTGASNDSLASATVRATGVPVPPSKPDDPPWVVLGDGVATVGMNSPPLFNGGTPLLSLSFEASPGGASCSVPWNTEVFTASCDIEGLDNGTQYTFTMAGVNAAGFGLVSDPTAPLTPGPTPPMGELSILEQPVRVLDTRTSNLPRPGQPVVVNVDAPPGAVAVAYNLTVTGTTGSGYASLTPTSTEVPRTSVTNWTAPGLTVANAHVSGLGPDGTVSVRIFGTAAHAILDVTGFYQPVSGFALEGPDEPNPPPPGSRFVPTPPARAYDSRTSDGPLAGGTSRTVDLAARVPAGAQAVAYTLTETGTARTGYLSVGLPGQQPPKTSVLNWSGPNQTVANTATAALDGLRRLQVFAGGTGSAHFIVDVIGYFTPVSVNPDGLMFVPIDPERAYDSRIDTPRGPLGAGNSITTTMAGAGVPPSAGAVAVNLTATGTRNSGWLALTPGGTFTPGGISTLNWMRSNSTVANGTIIGTSSNNVTTYAGGGSAHYLLDVSGYYMRPRQ